MLYLRTGLPGASKTLNTLKEICEDKNTANRPIYYNNIKLLMLDFAVCQSFAGYFYGRYFPQLSKAKQKIYRKTLMRLHADDELASVDSFPHLEQLYDAWLSNNGHVNMWLTWVRRCYPKSRIKPLEEYLNLTETPTFKELSRFQLDWRMFDLPTLWYELERGAVIVIDECQQWFPPRSPGSKVPRHCSEFETHRHKGYDVHLITQDAKLLDNHIRRLTGRHIHFFNPFTSNRVTRFQADKVFDPEDYHARQKTQSKIIKRDSKFYGLYWSADQHTHKFKIPLKALAIIPVLIILPILIWVITSGALIDTPEPKTLPSTSTVTNSPGNSVTAKSLDEAFSSSEPIPIPVHLFSEYDHPLAAVCQRMVFSQQITQVTPRSRSNTYYVQCEIQKQPEKNDRRRRDESDDSRTGPEDNWEVHTFDSNFLMRLGYQPKFDRGLLTLQYDDLLFIFPTM